MNVQEIQTSSQETSESMCISCGIFFGNQAFNKMCSKCYKKDRQTKQSPIKKEIQKFDKILLPILPKIFPEQGQQNKQSEAKEANKDRCTICKRKLKLLGIECRCGLFFCSSHRLPEDHSCSFDHKDLGKEKLAKQVVQMKKKKVEAI